MTKINLRICAECFTDKYISEVIFNNKDPFIGKCGACDSESVLVAESEKFVDEFEQLLEMYTDDVDGAATASALPIADRLKRDWGLFSDKSSITVETILERITGESFSGKKFIVDGDINSQPVSSVWEDFKAKIKHENRWFFEKPFDDSVMKNLFTLLLEERLANNEWYRSRVHDEDSVLQKSKMGPPPSSLSTHGRANPAGISYLYVASDIATAISETRPHPGQYASIAKIKFINIGNNFVDLRNPTYDLSPFGIIDTVENADLRDYYLSAKLLEVFSSELNLPIVPSKSSFDYTPTQYICEFIKSLNYDGVIYKSSLGDGGGFNLVSFKSSDDEYTIEQVVLHNVSSVEVQSNRVLY